MSASSSSPRPLAPNSLAARDVAALMHPASNLAKHEETGPFVIERGKGVFVFDDEGRPYIEAMAGLWCTALGYGVEELAETAAEQMRKLAYSPLFASKSHGPAIELAEKIKSMMPFAASKVFFGLSGSDANDTHIKLLWYANNARGRPEKKKIISRRKAYHGVTIMSASLTGLPGMHTDFDLPVPGVLHTECPHHYRFAEPGETEEAFSARLAEALRGLIEREGPETIAGFIAEPVMGAGGVIVPPAGYFDKIRPILAEHEIEFIDDEVICGFGRTGRQFGCETYGFEPDAMTIAKALSSAYLPISASVVSEATYQAAVEESRKLGNFGHGYTYTGHPVCAAVALKNLQLMEERKIVDHAASVAPHFQRRLAALGEHPLVGEARGVGLLGALELVANKKTKEAFPATAGIGAKMQDSCLAHGLIIRAIGEQIAFCPPLIISPEEIDQVFEAAEKGLNDTLTWARSQGFAI